MLVLPPCAAASQLDAYIFHDERGKGERVSKASEVRRFEALVIPNDALERGGVELLRAAIIDSELHVTLRPTFEEPHHWGELLSELVERIARSYAEQSKLNEQDVILRIRTAFISDDPSATGAAARSPTKKTARSSKRAAKKAANKPNKAPGKKTGRKSGKKFGKKSGKKR